MFIKKEPSPFLIYLMKEKTENSILKSLLKLAIPIVLANILHSAYQITDTFWVGRLGSGAVAAVSLSFPIIFFIISLGGGMAVAGGILVAQYKGKKDYSKINFMAGQTFLMMTFASILLSVLGYLVSPIIIKLMGADPFVVESAISYMRISFLGLIFLFIFFSFQSLMRGVGDVRAPALIVLSTVLLNLVLDPLFIMGYKSIPAFGVTGAAIATILTQALSAIIGVIILFRGKHGIRIKKIDLKPKLRVIKRIFLLGLPASISQSTRSLGMAMMIFIVAGFGTTVTAAYGIGGRILSFIIIPALGLSAATSTLVGQSIGAKKIKRAEQVAKTSAKLSFIVLTILGILLFIFAKEISVLFIPGEEAVTNIASMFIKIMALSFGFVGVQVVLDGVLVGAGSTFTAMVLTIISLWLLRVPLAYILSKYTKLNENGIWWAFPIANIIALLFTYLWYKKGRWKEKEITKEI